jgi:hypothetical protein
MLVRENVDISEWAHILHAGEGEFYISERVGVLEFQIDF